MKKMLSALLAFVLCLPLLPMPARAEGLPADGEIEANATVPVADGTVPEEEKTRVFAEHDSLEAGPEEDDDDPAREDADLMESVEVEDEPLENVSDPEDEPIEPGEALDGDRAEAPADELELDLADAVKTEEPGPADAEQGEDASLSDVNDELAALDEAGPKSIEETASLSDAALDNDALFQGYISRALGRKHSASYSAGNALEGTAWLLYNALREQVEAVAGGRRTSTEFTFTAAELGIESRLFTAAELGMYDFKQHGLLEALTGVSSVIHALLYDCPYDLYWFDKTEQMHMPAMIARGALEGAEARGLISVTIQLPVAGAYASGAYAVNTALPARVRAAAENIAAIIDRCDGMDNYGKLDSYRAAVCALAAYDSSAASAATPYGDPWQLVSVFDGDATTNVVCEGYAKAFKYLCDQSEFSGGVSCILATGSMSGGDSAGEHMWNVVSMPDGRNYLADITNCDAGTLGNPDGLFMKGSADGDPERGVYRVTCAGRDITYKYDLGTRDTHAAARLILAARDYNARQPDPTPEPTPEPAAPLRVTGFSGTIDKVYDGKTGAAAPDEGLRAGDVNVDAIVRILNVTFDSADVGEDIPCTLKLAVRKAYVGRYVLVNDTLRALGRVTPRPVTARYEGMPLEKFCDGSADVGMALTENLLSFEGVADDAVGFSWDPELRFDGAEVGAHTATVEFAITGETAGNYTIEPLVIPGNITSPAIVGFEYVDAPEVFSLSERPDREAIAEGLPATLAASLHAGDGDPIAVTDVTWTCADYGDRQTGVFTFVAEGDTGDFALASGVTWPIHTVTVVDGDVPEAEETANSEAEGRGEGRELSAAPKDIGDASISATVPDQPYTGSEMEPTDINVTDGDRRLVEGADYSIAGYKDNTAAGAGAVVILLGLGGYTGRREVTFNIVERRAESEGKITLDIGYEGKISKVYDGNTDVTADLGLICGNLMAGDALGDVVAATATYDDAGAGVDKNVTIELSLNPAYGDRYALRVTKIVRPGEIRRKKLTVTVSAAPSKIYDGDRTATIGTKDVTVSGAVHNEIAVSGITATYNSKDAGENKRVDWTVNLSGNLDNYVADGYTISGVTTGTIRKKALEIAGLGQARKNYDGNTSVPDSATCRMLLNGRIAGDDVSVTLDARYDDETAGVGKTVTYTPTLRGGDRDNYEIRAVTQRDGVIEWAAPSGSA